MHKKTTARWAPLANIGRSVQSPGNAFQRWAACCVWTTAQRDTGKTSFCKFQKLCKERFLKMCDNSTNVLDLGEDFNALPTIFNSCFSDKRIEIVKESSRIVVCGEGCETKQHLDI